MKPPVKTWNYYVVEAKTARRRHFEVGRTLLGTDWLNNPSQVLKGDGQWSSADEGHKFPSKKVATQVMRRRAAMNWEVALGVRASSDDGQSWMERALFAEGIVRQVAQDTYGQEMTPKEFAAKEGYDS